VLSCVTFASARLSRLDMYQSILQIIRVTRPRPRPFSEILFVSFREIVRVHPYAKLQVCGFTRFDDMFQGVPNFTRVTWPRPGPYSEFLSVHFGEIVHMHAYAKFEVCSFTGFGDIFEGVPNFIRVRDPGHVHFLKCYLSIFEKLFICIRVPNFKSVALRVLEICLRVCQIL